MKKFIIHPQSPQQRLISQTADALLNGAVIAIPTDSRYALATCLGNFDGMKRVRQIRQLDEDRLFTLVCKDLSNLSLYTKVHNSAFRLIRACTPGPYTFILPASSQVPKKLLETKRKEIGLRIPDNAVVQSLLEELDVPLVSVSIQLDDEYANSHEADAIEHHMGSAIDILLDCGDCGVEETTVVRWTDDLPEVIRHGKGKVTWN